MSTRPPLAPPPAVPAPAPPPLAAVADPAGASRACLDCGTRVDDAFCPRCGQEFEEAVALTTKLTFHDLIDDAVQVNRSFVRTLAILVSRPGRLTADYLSGRRTRHVSPSKLYVVVNFAFFLFVQWFDPITADVAAAVAGEQALAAAAQRHGATLVDQAASVEERIADVFPTWLFVLVPLMAVVLKGLYVRSGRTFAAHTVFAFHAVAFTMVAFVPGALAPEAHAEQAYNVALLGALPLWLVIGLRTAYGQGWLRTTLKAALVWTALVVLIALYSVNVVNYAVSAG